MMHWGWLILAFFVGTVAGVFLVGLLAAGRDECCYRQGFCQGLAEGHTAGFLDGIKELQRVG